MVIVLCVAVHSPLCGRPWFGPVWSIGKETNGGAGGLVVWFMYVPRGRISYDRRSSIGRLCFNPLLLPEGERAVFGYRVRSPYHE
jgi:hypothetical protein